MNYLILDWSLPVGLKILFRFLDRCHLRLNLALDAAHFFFLLEDFLTVSCNFLLQLVLLCLLLGDKLLPFLPLPLVLLDALRYGVEIDSLRDLVELRQVERVRVILFFFFVLSIMWRRGFRQFNIDELFLWLLNGQRSSILAGRYFECLLALTEVTKVELPADSISDDLGDLEVKVTLRLKNLAEHEFLAEFE